MKGSVRSFDPAMVEAAERNMTTEQRRQRDREAAAWQRKQRATEKASAEVDRVGADALASVTALRSRADRLTDQLATARTELARSTADADVKAAAVRAAMLNGDANRAERARDEAEAMVAKLARRVEDLTATADQARVEAEAAEAKAKRIASRRRIPAARDAKVKADAALESLKLRHEKELAEAEGTATDAAELLAAFERAAGGDRYAGELNEIAEAGEIELVVSE